jgi:hypothetical protein
VSFRQLTRHRGIVATATSAVAVMIAGGVVAAVDPVRGHETMSSAASSRSASGGSAATRHRASSWAYRNVATRVRPRWQRRLTTAMPGYLPAMPDIS